MMTNPSNSRCASTGMRGLGSVPQRHRARGWRGPGTACPIWRGALLALLSGLALSDPARAQLLAAEDFNLFSNGNLSGQGAWITLNASNLAFAVSTTNPIAYACYNGGDGGRHVAPSAGGVPYNQRLRYPTTNVSSIADQTFFVSAVVRPTAAGSDPEAHLIGLGNDFGGTNYEFTRIHIRAASGGINFGISEGNGIGLAGNASAGIEWGATVYPLNTSYLLVARYTYDNGGGANGDAIRLWVNPPTGSEPNPAAAEATILAGARGNDILFDGDNVRNLYLSSRDQGGVSPAYQLDGLRYARGTTSAQAWTNLSAGPLSCPTADLSIAKSNGTSVSTPGGSTTYTIVASNAGPDSVSSATVADTFPASLTCTWTCVGAGGGICTSSGTGNLSDSVNLPSGSAVTYTASCAISAAATGTLSNTATVTPPINDPNTGNNSATDSDNLLPQADVSITKSDGQTTVNAGGSTVYTISASNAGPSNAPATTVADSFPAFCVSPSWTCTGAGGGACAANGTGNLNQTVNLPAGGSVSFAATCPISGTATGVLSNTATVAAGVNDTNTGNNSATDTSSIVALPALSINDVSRSEGNSGSTQLDFTVSLSAPAPAGGVTYTIATADNSAVAPGDYTTQVLSAQTIAPGDQSRTFSVAVTGDLLVETNEQFFVNVSAISGADGADTQGVGTIQNDDIAGVIITPTDGSNAVSEGGSGDSLSVALSAQPAANVTVTLTGDANVSASPSALTFTAVNWNQAQIVTLAATDDARAEGSHSGTISFTTSSSHSAFNGLSVPSQTVAISDNDTAGFTISPLTGLTTTEAGGTATFTVALTSEPLAAVMLALNSSNTAEGTVAPTPLLFDASNWSAPQTVTLTGVDDALDDGDSAWQVLTGPVTSADPLYAGANPPDVSASNVDNDATPTFSAGASVSRQQGSAATTASVGTVNDVAPDTAGSLQVSTASGGTATGLSISSLTNTAGQVTAQLAAGCQAVAGTQRFRVTDAGGLSATADLQVDVTANTPPVLTYGAQTVTLGSTANITPTTAPSDNGSVSTVQLSSAGTFGGTVSVDANGVVSLSNATPPGTHVVRIAVTDNCGLSAEAQLQITVGQASTFKLLTANVNPVRYGQPLTLTAQLAGLAPTGSVDFMDGSIVLGTAPLVVSPSGGNNLKLATLSSSALPVGTRSITAVYAGDAANSGSTSAPLVLTVQTAGSRLNLLPATNPAPPGALLVSFDVAAEAPGGGVPQGSVTLTSGSSSCNAVLSAQGAGSCSLAGLTAGLRSIQGSYTPSGSNHAATTAATGVVVMAAGASADLRVRIGNGVRNLVAGQPVTYQIVIDHLGGDAAAARLQVPLAADFATGSYRCLSAGSASCGAPAGSGGIDTVVSLAPGGALIYQLTVTAPNPPDHDVTQTATITVSTPGTDPDASNNSAQDTDPMGLLADGYEDMAVDE